MNSRILSIIIVLVLVILGFLLFMGRDTAPLDVMPGETASETQGIAEGEPNPNTPAEGTTGEVKEFAVDGSNFSFTPATMVVRKGDTVRVTFTNRVGMHDWKLDEFNAATRVLAAGESETVEFVATEAGTFEYYCSVGSHRQLGMVGTLTVTE